jgi:hypothetical protein
MWMRAKTRREVSMKPMQPGVPTMEDPEAHLEQAFIDGYLRAKGVDAGTIHSLPETEATRLMTEASIYAASKLAEVEARAHFVHDVHGNS